MTTVLKNFNAVEVSTTDGWKIVGSLYIEGKAVIVLANSIVDGSDTGPLRAVKVRKIGTEADFIVIPRAKIESLKELRFPE